MEAMTKAVLPLFRKDEKPFLVVFWSRDPDGTQHNEGDSLNLLSPGINGPTSRGCGAQRGCRFAAACELHRRYTRISRETPTFSSLQTTAFPPSANMKSMLPAMPLPRVMRLGKPTAMPAAARR